MKKERVLRHIDWVLIGAIVPLVFAGLVTMNTFSVENYFFARQIVWLFAAMIIFFIAAHIDWRFLRHSHVAVIGYVVFITLLILLFLSIAINGAQSWFVLPGFSFQPSDFMKIILIVLLAKYFSRRHVQIAQVRHIIVSGLYAFVPFFLIALQPDLGTAAIIFFIWLGMVMFSGIPLRYLAVIVAIVALTVSFLWHYGLDPYQKDRILIFLDPWRDAQGAGYNALQSQIAVGSGQLIGKGVGFGTQSRLEFLPEYETDFIFAAFAEEWGFVGILIVLFLFGIIFLRLAQIAVRGSSNFESLFVLGYGVFLLSHVAINVGMNVGLLPITGITLPFMSYGGSHLLAEFGGLGMIMGMRRYEKRGLPSF